MNPLVQQLAWATAGRYLIDTELVDGTITVVCRNLEGKVVERRVFTREQMKNTPLVTLALEDLKDRLLH